MRIMAVDNDTGSLRNLVKLIKKCRQDAEVAAFSDSLQAMDYINEHKVCIVFTEIVMRDVTGFALTKHLKAQNRNIHVIFVTDSAEYAIHAWEAHVNGYIQKPVNYEKIKVELEYAIR